MAATTNNSTSTFLRSEPLPGLRLVTEPMPHVRSVSIGLWIDTGSRDEGQEVAGAAHFLEHMLFKGTATRDAQDIANAFDAVGGEVNAYSAREHTCFYARVLDDDLPMAVDVLGDMFRNATLREDEFASEPRVILEEIHMAADVPEDLVHDLFAEACWPSHALGRSVLGTTESIGSMTVDQLRAFYKSGYATDRLVVAVAGNISHDAVEEIVRNAFEPGLSPVRRIADAVPAFGAPRAVYDTRDSEQTHIVWGVPAVGRTDPDRYALSVLGSIYGGGMSSRLFQEVREKRGLAYSIYSAEHMYLETGSFAVYAGTQAETAAEVMKIVRDEAAKIMSGDVSTEEVERAKSGVRGGLVLSMDDPGGRMSRIGRSELVHGYVPTVDELLSHVDAVTVDDVTRVAQRVFANEGVLACVGQLESGSLDESLDPVV